MNYKYKKVLSYALFLVLPMSIIGCNKQVEKPPVIKKVKAVQIGDLSSLEKRAFPGKAQAIEEATLSFRISGQIETLQVKPGDKVKKGDLLSTLDNTDFANGVKVAEGFLAEAEAAYLDASRNYKRALDIQKSEPGVISQIMIDKAQATDSITRAAKVSATASLELAKDRLSYSQLTAPFDGEIVATYAEAHETVIAKQSVIRLINRDSMEFIFDVPERLIGYANNVEQANVIFDIRPNVKIPAYVKEIGREATRSTRTYPVTLTIENNKDFEVLPGMAGEAFINATLSNDSQFSGVDIPASALFSTGDIKNSFVWIIEDGKVTKRAVEVLRPTDFGMKIGSGLNKGEWIVVAGVNSLIENQPVRTMNATEGK